MGPATVVASSKTESKRVMRRLPKPQRRLVFWLHDVEDPVNVGSLFRAADALGVEELVLSGITAQPPHKLITKVGRAKDRRVPWQRSELPERHLADMKAEGWEVLAAEITPEAESCLAADYSERCILVLGHEDHGVPKRIMQVVDRAVFVPMYGKGASLNVATAGAILAFHIRHAGARS